MEKCIEFLYLEWMRDFKIQDILPSQKITIGLPVALSFWDLVEGSGWSFWYKFDRSSVQLS